MTHKTIVVFESDWEWMRIERDRLRADIELLRGANIELRGENVRLRAEVEALKIKNSSLCSALAEAADVMERAGIDVLAERYKAALRGEGEK